MDIINLKDFKEKQAAKTARRELFEILIQFKDFEKMMTEYKRYIFVRDILIKVQHNITEIDAALNRLNKFIEERRKK